MKYRWFHALALGALSAMLVSGCGKPDAAKAPDATEANPAGGEPGAAGDVGTPVDVDDVQIEMPDTARQPAPAAARGNADPGPEKSPAEPAEPAAEEAKGPKEWPNVPIFRALTDAVRKGATEAVVSPKEESP